MRSQRNDRIRGLLGETAARRRWRQLVSAGRPLAAAAVAALVLAVMATRLGAASIELPWAGEALASRQLYVTLGGTAFAAWFVLTLVCAAVSWLAGSSRRSVARFGSNRHLLVPALSGVLAMAAIGAVAVAATIMLGQMLKRDLGFESDGVYFAAVEAIGEGASPFSRLMSSLPAEPYRQAIAFDPRLALASAHPLAPGMVREMQLPGAGATRRLSALVNEFTPAYFRLLGIEITSGREPLPGARHEVVVSRSFAERYLGGRATAVQFELFEPFAQHPEVVTVVGVAEDAHRTSPKGPPMPVIYQPLGSAAGFWVVLGPEKALHAAAGRLREQVAIEGAWSIGPVRSLRELVDHAFAPERTSAVLLLALAIAMGVIGILASAALIRAIMLERRQEVAIRWAIGAREANIAKAALGLSPPLLVAVPAACALLALLTVRLVLPQAPLATAVVATAVAVLLLPAVWFASLALAWKALSEGRIAAAPKEDSA
jgi:hypothetical protein